MNDVKEQFTVLDMSLTACENVLLIHLAWLRNYFKENDFKEHFPSDLGKYRYQWISKKGSHNNGGRSVRIKLPDPLHQDWVIDLMEFDAVSAKFKPNDSKGVQQKLQEAILFLQNA